MAKPHPDSEFVAYVLELMQPLGPVRARRMFGGHGLFLDDRMFALIVHGTLYLKTDDQNRKAFERHGLPPFSYTARNRVVSIAYHQAPEDSLEDADAMRAWAQSARAASLRAAR
ncbi:TfoX/Sxy family protein [Acidihalobacter prosperus]|uniref:TfoX N-terminal domain-containing protein n=1 Tax=Acidihalobacter prosperus TaxID=160660 RepID=A0A1A6C5D1_9GAMM|nr:TfoX/Sxy family protein [Acidihalobacter prosperus]OBS09768.1 hypothetical protein Thpro_020818 [Acidihalobacter prosperus]